MVCFTAWTTLFKIIFFRHQLPSVFKTHGYTVNIVLLGTVKRSTINFFIKYQDIVLTYMWVPFHGFMTTLLLCHIPTPRDLSKQFSDDHFWTQDWAHMTNGLGALKMQLGVQWKGSAVSTPCTIQMAKPLEAFSNLVPKQLK